MTASDLAFIIGAFSIGSAFGGPGRFGAGVFLITMAAISMGAKP